MIKLLFISLILFGSTVFAGDSTGSCEKTDSTSSCMFINQTGKVITQISWLLEGSDVDYGEDVPLTLAPGKAISLSNYGDTDNCLFTPLTTITAFTDTDVIEMEGTSFRFNQGSCAIVIEK